ncbi:amidohydrolase family protein [Planctomycetota bacterium]
MKKIDIHLHPVKDDPGMDKYVEAMEKGDVVAGLVHGLPKNWGDTPGDSNKDILEACEKHPGKLFGSLCVNFRDPIDEIIAEIKDYAAGGFKSIKLFPNYGFDPSDEAFDEIWEVVEELGLMCLSHCGWLGDCNNPTKNVDQMTARPFAFERAARNHQGIDFIMAHFGGAAFYLETCVLTLRLKNFFADTCPGWGKWVFEQKLPGLYGLDFSKIMYGTDNIGTWGEYNDDVGWWTGVHKAMGRGPEDLERYFYGNAAKLLGIEEE